MREHAFSSIDLLQLQNNNKLKVLNLIHFDSRFEGDAMSSSSSPQRRAKAASALLDRAAASIDKTAGLLEEATLVTEAAAAKSAACRRQWIERGGEAEEGAGQPAEQPTEQVESLCRSDRLLQWLKWQQWIEGADRECRRRMAEDGADDGNGGKEGGGGDKKAARAGKASSAAAAATDLSEIEVAMQCHFYAPKLEIFSTVAPLQTVRRFCQEAVP